MCTCRGTQDHTHTLRHPNLYVQKHPDEFDTHLLKSSASHAVDADDNDVTHRGFLGGVLARGTVTRVLLCLLCAAPIHSRKKIH